MYMSRSIVTTTSFDYVELGSCNILASNVSLFCGPSRTRLGAAGSGSACGLERLATGVLIAAYTLIDGQGARAGSTPHAYAGWLFLLTSIPIIALAMKTLRKDFRSLLAGHWKMGVPFGVLSAFAYWVIVWAMSVAPMALVAAARETSILFAAVVSWGVLGEKLRPLRWAGVVVTVVGLLLAKF